MIYLFTKTNKQNQKPPKNFLKHDVAVGIASVLVKTTVNGQEEALQSPGTRSKHVLEGRTCMNSDSWEEHARVPQLCSDKSIRDRNPSRSGRLKCIPGNSQTIQSMWPWGWNQTFTVTDDANRRHCGHENHQHPLWYGHPSGSFPLPGIPHYEARPTLKHRPRNHPLQPHCHKCLLGNSMVSFVRSPLKLAVPCNLLVRIHRPYRSWYQWSVSV